MKINILKHILIVGLIISIIEFIKLTVVYTLAVKAGFQELVLEHLTNYYLCIIIIILCAGFLYLKQKKEVKK